MHAMPAMALPSGPKSGFSSFKVVDKSFFDVNIEFEVVGSEPYALGYALASEFDAKELAAYYTSNPSYLNAKHEDMSYNGSFVELFADGATKLESGAPAFLFGCDQYGTRKTYSPEDF